MSVDPKKQDRTFYFGEKPEGYGRALDSSFSQSENQTRLTEPSPASGGADLRADSRQTQFPDKGAAPSSSVVLVANRFNQAGFSQGMQFFPDAVQAVRDPSVNPHSSTAAAHDHGALQDQERELGDQDPAHFSEIADEAARDHQQEMRNLVNLAAAGILHNGKVGLKQGEGRHGAHTADKEDLIQQAMTNLMMQRAYQEAYDNEVSFLIGGKARKMKQGDMYNFAKERLEKTEKELEEARARGDHEKVRHLTDKKDAYQEITDLMDPTKGKATAQGIRRTDEIFGNHKGIEQEFDARFEQDTGVAPDIEKVESASVSMSLEEMSSSLAASAPRTVSAAKGTEGAVFASAGNVTPIFGQAAENIQKSVPAPAPQVAQAEPEVSVIKAKSQAFNL